MYQATAIFAVTIPCGKQILVTVVPPDVLPLALVMPLTPQVVTDM